MAVTYNQACGCARKHLGIARVNLAEAVEQSARDASQGDKISPATRKSADNAWENLATAESEHFVEMIQGTENKELKAKFVGLMDRTRKIRQELMLSGVPAGEGKASTGTTESLGSMAKEVEGIKSDLDRLGVEYGQEQISGCDTCIDYAGGEKVPVDLDKIKAAIEQIIPDLKSLTPTEGGTHPPSEVPPEPRETPVSGEGAKKKKEGVSEVVGKFLTELAGKFQKRLSDLPKVPGGGDGKKKSGLDITEFPIIPIGPPPPPGVPLPPLVIPNPKAIEALKGG